MKIRNKDLLGNQNIKENDQLEFQYKNNRKKINESRIINLKQGNKIPATIYKEFKEKQVTVSTHESKTSELNIVKEESKKTIQVAKRKKVIIAEKKLREQRREGKIIEARNNSKIANDMIDIWNEVNQPAISITLTNVRSRILPKALEKSFGGDLEQWKQYCFEITTSKFLMGEKQGINIKFRADIDWSIKEHNRIKIKEKAYGIGDRKANIITSENISNSQRNDSSYISNTNNTSTVNAQIEAISDPIWREVAKRLKAEHSEAYFKSWFSKIGLECIEGDTAIINAPSKFIGEWITTYHAHHISGAINSCITRSENQEQVRFLKFNVISNLGNNIIERKETDVKFAVKMV